MKRLLCSLSEYAIKCLRKMFGVSAFSSYASYLQTLGHLPIAFKGTQAFAYALVEETTDFRHRLSCG